MKLGVVGAGHVGLPTAVSLAAIGHEVWVHDLDRGLIASLADGHGAVLRAGSR